MPLPNLGEAMRRRDFIKVIAGSAAATWPLSTRAQQGERPRHVGVLMYIPENDQNGTGPRRGVPGRHAAIGLV